MNITQGQWTLVPSVGAPGMWEIRPEGPFRGTIAYVFATKADFPAIPAEEAEANAKALVLLPELVKALEDLIPFVPGWADGDQAGRPWLKNAQAVLSKLKGTP